MIQFKLRQKQQLHLNPLKNALNIEDVNHFKLIGITIDTALIGKLILKI